MTVTRGTTNRNDRGSASDRRARKAWLIAFFGDGITAQCSYCRVRVTLATITVDRYPIPGCQGGTYARDNIRPACGPCNSSYGGRLRRSA